MYKELLEKKAGGSLAKFRPGCTEFEGGNFIKSVTEIYFKLLGNHYFQNQKNKKNMLLTNIRAKN